MQKIYAIGAIAGVAVGTIYPYQPVRLKIRRQTVQDPMSQKNAFYVARAKVIDYLHKTTNFANQINLLRNTETAILNLIDKKKYHASWAIEAATSQEIEKIIKIDGDYLNDQVVDLENLQFNLLTCLNNLPFSSLKNPPNNCIVVAKDLTPADIIQINTKSIKGLVLENGALTSHTTIFARSLNIPMVINANDICKLTKNHSVIAINGEKGEIVINPDIATWQDFQHQINEFSAKNQQFNHLINKKAAAINGKTIDLFNNINSPTDLDLIDQNNLEGVGLFRSESLFMNKLQPLSETAQFHTYKKILTKLNNRPLYLRLIDIGADKLPDFLDFAKKDNSLLGMRGARVYRYQLDIFISQIRAILKASQFGNLALIIPMISCVKEVLWVKQEIVKQIKILHKQGFNLPKIPKIGIMIETPSAVLIANQLAKNCDFFTIGSNDLTQYIMAVDKNNPKISNPKNNLNPAILKAMQITAKAAQKEQIPLAICGEIDLQLEIVPFLLALGFDQLSISGNNNLQIKDLICKLRLDQCQDLLTKALELDCTDKITELANTLIYQSNSGNT